MSTRENLASMTGFGRGHAGDKKRKISVEIRTVNARFFELRPKLPRPLFPYEPLLREEVSRKIRRGTVDLTVAMENLESVSAHEFDEKAARAYLGRGEAVAKEFGISAGLTAANLFRLPGVWSERADRSGEAGEECLPLLKRALHEALEQIREMRAAEGEKLGKVLERELESLHTHRDWIHKHREELNEKNFRKLEGRMKEWMERAQGPVDQTRLYQEVAYYLDRSDITEELDRLASHLRQCDDAVRGVAGGSAGKRLEFLAQELGREVNTIGAKTDQAQVSSHIVEMKLSLERIREQVQNLE